MAHILIIEADENLGAALVTILQLEGHSVAYATNGNKGVALLHSQPPDLVLCGVSLPFIDGYGVLQALRQHAPTATTPLIFLTSYLANSDLRRGVELGANGYLIKPFTMQELLHSVRNTLNHVQCK